MGKLGKRNGFRVKKRNASEGKSLTARLSLRCYKPQTARLIIVSSETSSDIDSDHCKAIFYNINIMGFHSTLLTRSIKSAVWPTPANVRNNTTQLSLHLFLSSMEDILVRLFYQSRPTQITSKPAPKRTPTASFTSPDTTVYITRNNKKYLSI